MSLFKSNEGINWPYSRKTYLLRVLWNIVQNTLWVVCWKRIYILRTTLLKIFGAQSSYKVQISRTVNIFFPWLFKCGSHTAISDRVNIYNLGGIEIGDHVVISQDVYICGGTHDYTSPTYPLIRKNIVIGNGVWICAGAFIGPGVQIGEGAVVGARAVVTKDVEPWSVVAGNPAVYIKQRDLTSVE